MKTKSNIKCNPPAMVPIGDLKSHPKNPKVHPPDQIRLLAKIISYQGFRETIVVSRRSGFIVAGHARLAAARLLKFDTVPVDFQDFDSDEQELAHLVADNRIAEIAETDAAILQAIEAEFSEIDFDMELTGLSLAAADADGELKPIKAPPPPGRVWFLIGVPIEKMPEIQKPLQKLTGFDFVWCQSTANDDNENR